MSCVFQNIDPQPPSPLGECVPPPFVAGGGNTRRVEGGWGVNILEDARHSSVLYPYRILFGFPYTMLNLRTSFKPLLLGGGGGGGDKKQ
jgi:hypothetical protein